MLHRGKKQSERRVVEVGAAMAMAVREAAVEVAEVSAVDVVVGSEGAATAAQTAAHASCTR